MQEVGPNNPNLLVEQNMQIKQKSGTLFSLSVPSRVRDCREGSEGKIVMLALENGTLHFEIQC
jgi:hypothetical protein